MRDEMFPGVWNAMRGLRNRVAHGYQAVNPEVLKLTARLDIPLVKEAVSEQLQKLVQRDADGEVTNE